MEQYDNDINDNNRNRKKTAIETKMHWRFITSIALPTLSLLLMIISAAPTYPVQATAGSNETAATPAPGGASIGPAGGGTNVTQSDCLPQNATTTNQSSAVNASGANDTTVTVAPSGASIGANDTSTLNATAGNTTTTNNTTVTVAPSGASVC
jgi:uncharacterized protein with beta-barrel porin domain